MAKRVLVYGGKGALGSAAVSQFKSSGWVRAHHVFVYFRQLSVFSFLLRAHFCSARFPVSSGCAPSTLSPTSTQMQTLWSVQARAGRTRQTLWRARSQKSCATRKSTQLCALRVDGLEAMQLPKASRSVLSFVS